MGTTTNMGFRYPSGTVGVAPDVAGDIHNLATDVDTAFAKTVIDRTDPGTGALTDDWNNATEAGIYRIAGTLTNANSPIGAGAYGFGTLSVFSTINGGVTQMYVSAEFPNVWMRTKWTTTWSPWTLLNNPGTVTGTGVTSTGWTVNRFDLRKIGSIVHLDFSGTRNGGTITGTASGNIVNVQVGNVGSWVPATAFAPLGPGPGGPTCSLSVDNTGKLLLAAMPPSYNLVNGQEITCGGSWVTNA